MPSRKSADSLLSLSGSVLSYLKTIGLFSLLVILQTTGAIAGGLDSVKPLPGLKDAIQSAIKQHSATDKVLAEYEVSKYYYKLLTRREQLEISDEVKGHFETAVTKANERMESEDGEVTQSAITKLKLGLSGTNNDISNFNADIQKARLHLEYWLGHPVDEMGEVSDDGLIAVKFAHKDLESFQKTQGTPKPLSGVSRLQVLEAFIDVNKSREKYDLARKTRRLTRALLVTEVANYDFGIGDEGDLFEALIIYTRVLVGYYDTIYQFNLSVLDLKKLLTELP